MRRHIVKNRLGCVSVEGDGEVREGRLIIHGAHDRGEVLQVVDPLPGEGEIELTMRAILAAEPLRVVAEIHDS